MTYGYAPFGLRDIKVTNIAGTVQADLPIAQKLKLTVRLKSGRLKNDFNLTEAVSLVDSVEWSLEAGGIDLDALAIITGQAVSVTGTTPNEVTTLNLAAGDDMPYFKIYGKSLGDSTDDVYVQLFMCKVTGGIEGLWEQDKFHITNLSGIAIDGGAGILEIVQEETDPDLPDLPPGDWYEAVGGGLAAYDPYAAADLAASQINLLNPGTYDCTVPGTYTPPTHVPGVGWDFIAAQFHVLDTGITPAAFDGTWSMFAWYADVDATVWSRPILSAGSDAGQYFDLWTQAQVDQGRFFGMGDQSISIAPFQTGGWMGINGRDCWINGAKAWTLPAITNTAATGWSIWIGIHRRAAGTRKYALTAKGKRFWFADRVLTDWEVTRLYNHMVV